MDDIKNRSFDCDIISDFDTNDRYADHQTFNFDGLFQVSKALTVSLLLAAQRRLDGRRVAP